MNVTDFRGILKLSWMVTGPVSADDVNTAILDEKVRISEGICKTYHFSTFELTASDHSWFVARINCCKIIWYD